MTNDIEQLRKDYRAAKAPPWLATRIAAHTRDGRPPSRRWIPAATTLAVALAVFAAVPLIDQVSDQQKQPPTVPSLSKLASIAPGKPSMAVPGMSKIRSVKRPALPQKPSLKKDKRTKGYLQPEEAGRKENERAYI